MKCFIHLNNDSSTYCSVCRRPICNACSNNHDQICPRCANFTHKTIFDYNKKLLKLLIPVALVIVLLFLIKVLTPDKDPTNETTPAAQITVENQHTDAVETTPAETETASAVTVTYKTTTTLNVRSGPSTDSEKIGKFDPDKTVEYVRDHDDFWAVILYNGQEAYVAKEYLTPVTE